MGEISQTIRDQSQKRVNGATNTFRKRGKSGNYRGTAQSKHVLLCLSVARSADLEFSIWKSVTRRLNMYSSHLLEILSVDPSPKVHM